MDPSRTSILVGPPGTGKTTSLLNIVEEALVAGVKPWEIGFISFTTKAANEGKSRAIEKLGIEPEQLPHFRTLHSMAFKYLGMRRDQVVSWSHLRELGKLLGIEFKGRGEVAEDDVYGMNSADRMLFLEGLARNTGIPLKKIWEDAFEDAIDWFELERFASGLKRFKQSRKLYDYTDMLERFCNEAGSNLPHFKLLIIDEAQDLSPLQWRAVEILSKNSDKVYVAGDDDQCHPPGTGILTANRGIINIEELDKEDGVVYWRRDTHCFHGFKCKPGKIQIGSRPFSGKLRRINNNLRVTPEHRMVVRLKNQTQDWRCVYLMRRGDWFRVGQCQLFGPQNQLHLGVRMRLEKADSVWILSLTKDAQEALIAEQTIACTYQLPQICFENKLAKAVFENVPTKGPAIKCLLDRNLSPRFPWLDKKRAREKSGGTSIMQMEACNLLPDIMEIPEVTSYKKTAPCKWSSFTLSLEDYTGPVYSLNVETFHTYVAEGFGVHNCIYKWAGADVDRFIALEGKTTTLERSYRLPTSVFHLAESITQKISLRRPKKWYPREEKGVVNWHSDIEEVDLSRGTWLLLARNGYMLDGLEDWCMTQGFSFHSVNRDPLKSPSLQAIRTWEQLRKGAEVSADQALDALKYLQPSHVSPQLMKQLKGDDSNRKYKMPELKSGGLKVDVIWHQALTKISPKERDFFIAARKRGEPLLKEPRINISTIHGSKGGQADNVLLLTDMSYRCYNNMQTHPDDEARVWYVAATRCKESLNLVMPKTNLNFEL